MMPKLNFLAFMQTHVWSKTNNVHHPEYIIPMCSGGSACGMLFLSRNRETGQSLLEDEYVQTKSETQILKVLLKLDNLGCWLFFSKQPP